MNQDRVKKYYNDLLRKEPDYIEKRWFRNKYAQSSYTQTEKFLKKHLRDKNFSQGLEIGCGAGAWTPLFASRCKNLLSLDISKEMLRQAKRNVTAKNVAFVEGDFLTYNFPANRKYDLVVAIRVFEYLHNKEEALKKMAQLVPKGGALIIITKNPTFAPKLVAVFLERIPPLNDLFRKFPLFPKELKRLVSTYQSEIHEGWISISQLRKLFFKCGFAKYKLAPVVTTFIPTFLSTSLNFLVLPFVESYALVAEK